MSASSKLDPIMKVEVVTPEDYVTDIIIDLKGASVKSSAPTSETTRR